FLLLLLCASPAVRAADLAVSVLGVRSSMGTMRIAIFSDPAEFPSGEEEFARNVPAIMGDMKVVLPDVLPGTYALALHHDENDSDEMDTNFLGIPLEGYGFSNDARVFLGPPSFSAAAFEVPVGGGQVAVTVRY